MENDIRSVDISKIYSLINDLKITDIHKEFYRVMLKVRYEKIIKYSYEKLMEKKL